MSLLGFYNGSMIWDDRGLIPIGNEEFALPTPKAYVDPGLRFAFGYVGNKIDRINHPYIITAVEQLLVRLQTYTCGDEEVASCVDYLWKNTGHAIFVTKENAWYMDRQKIFVVTPELPVAFGTGASAFIAGCILDDDPGEAAIFASEFDCKTSGNISRIFQKDMTPFSGVPVKKPAVKTKIRRKT